ncbi:hypothetical protein BaRGS_00028166 [Batillaria attramentaria]|uniref:Uncharacterized protein n=1 Tax=Batillaria attramentaria TaxID=370345 RepID=A0ABD0JZP0_9CAEN
MWRRRLERHETDTQPQRVTTTRGEAAEQGKVIDVSYRQFLLSVNTACSVSKGRTAGEINKTGRAANELTSSNRQVQREDFDTELDAPVVIVKFVKKATRTHLYICTRILEKSPQNLPPLLIISLRKEGFLSD